MQLTERLQRSRTRRDARVLGRRAALGFAHADAPDTDGSGAQPRTAATCPECGGPGRVELLDLPGAISHLRCPRCDAAWRVVLDERSPEHGSPSLR